MSILDSISKRIQNLIRHFFLIILCILSFCLCSQNQSIAANKVFLIDTSKSMKKVFAELKSTIKKDFVEKMEKDESIAIITFDNNADIRIDTKLSTDFDKQRIHDVVDSLQPVGDWTWMSKALQVAEEKVLEYRNNMPDKDVILYFLTDAINDPPPEIKKSETIIDIINLWNKVFSELKRQGAYIHVQIYANKIDVSKKNDSYTVTQIDTEKSSFLIKPQVTVEYIDDNSHAISTLDLGNIDNTDTDVEKKLFVKVKDINGSAIDKLIYIRSSNSQNLSLSQTDMKIENKGQVEEINLKISKEVFAGNYEEKILFSSEEVSINPVNEITIKFNIIRPEITLVLGKKYNEPEPDLKKFDFGEINIYSDITGYLFIQDFKGDINEKTLRLSLEFPSNSAELQKLIKIKEENREQIIYSSEKQKLPVNFVISPDTPSGDYNFNILASSDSVRVIPNIIPVSLKILSSQKPPVSLKCLNTNLNINLSTQDSEKIKIRVEKFANPQNKKFGIIAKLEDDPLTKNNLVTLNNNIFEISYVKEEVLIGINFSKKISLGKYSLYLSFESDEAEIKNNIIKISVNFVCDPPLLVLGPDNIELGEIDVNTKISFTLNVLDIKGDVNKKKLNIRHENKSDIKFFQIEPSVIKLDSSSENYTINLENIKNYIARNKLESYQGKLVFESDSISVYPAEVNLSFKISPVLDMDKDILIKPPILPRKNSESTISIRFNKYTINKNLIGKELNFNCYLINSTNSSNDIAKKMDIDVTPTDPIIINDKEEQSLTFNLDDNIDNGYYDLFIHFDSKDVKLIGGAEKKFKICVR